MYIGAIKSGVDIVCSKCMMYSSVSVIVDIIKNYGVNVIT